MEIPTKEILSEEIKQVVSSIIKDKDVLKETLRAVLVNSNDVKLDEGLKELLLKRYFKLEKLQLAILAQIPTSPLYDVTIDCLLSAVKDEESELSDENYEAIVSLWTEDKILEVCEFKEGA